MPKPDPLAKFEFSAEEKSQPSEGGAGGPETEDASDAGAQGEFTAVETAILGEARTILESPEFDRIRAANAAGESGVAVHVGDRLIQYEHDLPPGMHAMTLHQDNGFVIGQEAFQTTDETARTVLHELHRLHTSQSASGLTGEMATAETEAAFEFAKRAAKEL